MQEKGIQISRSPQNSNYRPISTFHFDDKRLSFRAKGILTYLLIADGNEMNIDILSDHANDTFSDIESGLKELEKTGYLYRSNDEWIINDKRGAE